MNAPLTRPPTASELLAHPAVIQAMDEAWGDAPMPDTLKPLPDLAARIRYGSWLRPHGREIRGYTHALGGSSAPMTGVCRVRRMVFGAQKHTNTKDKSRPKADRLIVIDGIPILEADHADGSGVPLEFLPTWIRRCICSCM